MQSFGVYILAVLVPALMLTYATEIPKESGSDIIGK